MTDEKWQDIRASIQEKFSLLQEGNFERPETKETVQYMIFQCPSGKIKLERIQKPFVIGRKVISSKRPGSFVAEELEYSDTRGDTLKAFRWNTFSSDWEKIDADMF